MVYAPIKIVIADDHEIFREGFKLLLKNQRELELVGEAENGRELLETITRTEPDIVITDIKMPVMDGIEVAIVLAEGGIAPAVLLTAYSDTELISRAKDAGVFGYLTKPFKPSDLAPAIEVARSRFEQNQQLTKEVATLTERLEARKSVDKAKGVLMSKEGIDEAEAYRRIQQQSMNQRLSMREVADAIIVADGV